MKTGKKPLISVQVQTFGGFSISAGGKTIDGNAKQTQKAWFLLKYLTVFHKKELSSEELIDYIWGEDIGSNPAGALKTLLFRTRALLEPWGVPVKKLIVQQNGAYTWSDDVELVIDFERFDTLCARIFANSADTALCKEAGEEAIALYKGDFFSQSAWESWVIPINTYYHNLYIKLIHRLIDIYSSEQAYSRIIDLCSQAIMITSFDEEVHYNMIYALYKSGDGAGAIKHYHQMMEQFYNEFSIVLPQRLTALYKVIQSELHQTETDLSAIQDKLLHEVMATGAFNCEYPVFKDIYLLKSRILERTGDSVYLCLLTMNGKKSSFDSAGQYAKPMEALLESICRSLRKSDVCCRYSTNQYLVMLSSTTGEDAAIIAARILKNFSEHYPQKNLQTAFALRAVSPLNE